MKTNHAQGNIQNDTKVEETSTEQNLQMYEPPEADENFSSEEKIFINDVFKLLENEVIDLHVPSTLLNKSIYDASDEKVQGIADRSAINFYQKFVN